MRARIVKSLQMIEKVMQDPWFFEQGDQNCGMGPNLGPLGWRCRGWLLTKGANKNCDFQEG
tara:strand:+ start:290 stop:472 length:183 start_codon:yes stop_codon:yes gene_type:complete